jgi:hypothetical protein
MFSRQGAKNAKEKIKNIDSLIHLPSWRPLRLCEKNEFLRALRGLRGEKILQAEGAPGAMRSWAVRARSSGWTGGGG